MQIQACLQRREEYLNFTLLATGYYFFASSIASIIKYVMSLSSFCQAGVQSSVMT